MSLLNKLLRIPVDKGKGPLASELKAYHLHKAYTTCFCDDKGNLTDMGRIVLADLCRQGGVIHPMPTRNVDGSISIEDTFLNEGKREMVLGIMRRIFKKASLGQTFDDPETEREVIETLTQEIQET